MAEILKTSIRCNPNGDWPQVDPRAYIDPTAILIGNVHIGADVFIGPNAVIRADEVNDEGQVEPIKISAQCNVQDGAIIHALGGTKVTIGQRSSLSHGCIIHGPCTIGKGCFIGFRSVVFDSILADEIFVGAGAIIQGVNLTAKSNVPAGLKVLCQNSVSTICQTGLKERQFMGKVIASNLNLVKGYLS